MALGLVDSRWETRHGCALGLTAVLAGLGLSPRIDGGGGTTEASHPDLPSFLVEDIACAAFCLLVCDRFVDFGSATTGLVSPVKDAAARLVACASLCRALSAPQRVVVMQQALNMAAATASAAASTGGKEGAIHWSVRYGSMLLLKYLVPLHWRLLLEADEPGGSSQATAVLAAVEGCLRDPIDDVSGAAAAVLRSVEVAVCGGKRADATVEAAAGAASPLPATHVRRIVDALRVSATGLDQLASRVPALASAFSSACALLDGGIDADAEHILTGMSVLVSKLGMSTVATKRLALRNLLPGLAALARCLQTPSTAPPPPTLLRAAGGLWVRAVCALVTVSTQSLGDLHLVDEHAHKQPRASAAVASDKVAPPPHAADTASALLTLCADVSSAAARLVTTVAARRPGGTRARAFDALCSLSRALVHSLDADLPSLSSADAGNHGGDDDVAGLCSAGLEALAGAVAACAEEDADDALVLGRRRRPPCLLTFVDPAWGLSALASALEAAIAAGGSAHVHDHVDDGGALQALFAALTTPRARPAAPPPAAVPAQKQVKLRFQISFADDDDDADDSDGLLGHATKHLAATGRSTEQQHTGALAYRDVALLLCATKLAVGLATVGIVKNACATTSAALAVATTGAIANEEAALRRLLGAVGRGDVAAILEAACSSSFNDHGCRPLLCTVAADAVLASLHETPRPPSLPAACAVLAAGLAGPDGGCPRCAVACAVLGHVAARLGVGVFDEVFPLPWLPGAASRDETCAVYPFASCFIPTQGGGGRMAFLRGMAAVLPHTATVPAIVVVAGSIAQGAARFAAEATTAARAVDLAADVILRLAAAEHSAAAGLSRPSAFAQAVLQCDAVMAAAAAATVSGDGGRRGGAARLLHRLVQDARDRAGAATTVLLHDFVAVLGATLRRLGDPEPAVRRPAVAALRLLVPLAALATTRPDVVDAGGDGANGDGDAAQRHRQLCDLAEHVLSRGRPPRLDESTRAVDVAATAQLRRQAPAAALALRPYQWEGVSWLTHLRRCGLGGVLADEMGLGKTLQALAALAIMHLEAGEEGGEGEGEGRRSLVVCPSVVVLHWAREVAKFFPATLLRPVVLDADGRCDVAGGGDGVVVIASYDAVRRDKGRMLNVGWTAVVLDEAHVVRNPASPTAQAVFRLRARFRMALTGTPIHGHVRDLWGVLHFLVPDYLGDFASFEERVVRPVAAALAERRGGNDALISARGLQALRDLHEVALPFVLRRTKAGVAADLPPKTVVDVPCPLAAAQREMYVAFLRGLRLTDDALQAQLRGLKGGGAEGGAAPLQALRLLNLVSLHPALAVAEHLHRAYRARLLTDPYSSGKLLTLAKLLLDTGVVLPDESTAAFRPAEGEAAAAEAAAGPAAIVVEDAVRALDCDSDGGSDGDASDEEEEDEEEEKEDEDGAAAKRRRLDPAPPPPLPPAPAPALDGTLRRCLVFAQHREALDLVETCVLRRYFATVPYARLDGAVPAATRAAVAAQFNEQRGTGPDGTGPPLRLLLMTTGACGLGLNLEAADTVVFVEHAWNPFVDLQAADRAHRLGQVGLELDFVLLMGCLCVS
jgi:hypothetical protein